MYYRRKIILSLIELLGGEVEKLRLQKLLFIYAQRKSEPEYDFIPYKYGCYSYSAKADLNTMVKKGVLNETENLYTKETLSNYIRELKVNDQKLVREVVSKFGSMDRKSLIKHTYINYPFYAINSTIAEDLLPDKLMERVRSAKPNVNSTSLFTIGYEGISLEKYLEKLLKNNVKLLVDVRRNPLSMKFGFSKSLLKKYTNSLNIEYIHIPEVGIASDQRKSLETQEDYDQLFKIYKETTLQDSSAEQEKIFELLSKYKRIALTCFEADKCQCHRSHLATSISNLKGFEYPIIHL